MADGLERQIFEAANRDEDIADQDIDSAVSEAIRAVTPSNERPQERPAERRPQPQGRDPLEGIDDRSNSGLLRALLDERDRRQDLNNQLQRYQTREREQAKAAERPPINERLFIDPEGTLNELRQEWTRPLEQQLAQVQINQDFAGAQGRHGQEAFQQAWEAWYETVRDGKDAQTYFSVMNSASPGEAMVQWHRRQSLITEVGDDLPTYKQKIIDDYLASQGLATSPPRDRTNGQFTQRPQAPRFPTSISRISAPSNHGADDDEGNDGSEDAIFAAARPPPRRR